MSCRCMKDFILKAPKNDGEGAKFNINSYVPTLICLEASHYSPAHSSRVGTCQKHCHKLTLCLAGTNATNTVVSLFASNTRRHEETGSSCRQTHPQQVQANVSTRLWQHLIHHLWSQQVQPINNYIKTCSREVTSSSLFITLGRVTKTWWCQKFFRWW